MTTNISQQHNLPENILPRSIHYRTSISVIIRDFLETTPVCPPVWKVVTMGGWECRSSRWWCGVWRWQLIIIMIATIYQSPGTELWALRTSQTTLLWGPKLNWEQLYSYQVVLLPVSRSLINFLIRDSCLISGNYKSRPKWLSLRDDLS